MVEENGQLVAQLDGRSLESDKNDNEELTMKELMQSYRTMYQKFLQIVKVNDKIDEAS